jgi:hypothetical protein
MNNFYFADMKYGNVSVTQSLSPLMIFRTSEKNFIHCRRNSSTVDESHLTERINLLQQLNVFVGCRRLLCFHISEKNIIHKRRAAATKEENHLIKRIKPLQQLNKSFAAEDLYFGCRAIWEKLICALQVRPIFFYLTSKFQTNIFFLICVASFPFLNFTKTIQHFLRFLSSFFSENFLLFK